VQVKQGNDIISDHAELKFTIDNVVDCLLNSARIHSTRRLQYTRIEYSPLTKTLCCKYHKLDNCVINCAVNCDQRQNTDKPDPFGSSKIKISSQISNLQGTSQKHMAIYAAKSWAKNTLQSFALLHQKTQAKTNSGITAKHLHGQPPPASLKLWR
jgi:hypothetical protein